MEDTLKFPVGKIPEFPPKNLPPEVIEAWRTELRLDLHRRGLLEKILNKRRFGIRIASFALNTRSGAR